jgi:nitroreductase
MQKSSLSTDKAMNILNSILNRKSQPVIDGEIDQDDLHLILQCALTAPDHKALRPWKYIICRPQDKNSLVELIYTATVKLKVQKANIDVTDLPENEKDVIKRKITQKINSAPYIIIATLDANVEVPINEIELVLSAGAAIQNIIVAAESIGYSCFWRTGDWAYNPMLIELLGLSKTTKITGFIGLGKMANQKMAVASKRPAFEEHFSYF